jgi:hypothetical protein
MQRAMTMTMPKTAAWTHRAALSLGLLATAGLSLPAVSHADGPALAKYAGKYKYKGKKEKGEKIVDEAVDKSLADLSAVMRMMIKKAMEARKTPFIEAIAIETPTGKIAIKMGDSERVETKVNGSETVKRDGRSGKVTHSYADGKLTQRVEGEGGTIRSVMTLEKDGKTLHRDVTIENERLKKPIKYRLTYTRQ